jgi:hypothetical protein
MADTSQTQRQNAASQIQRDILNLDVEIRRARDKLIALKRAHGAPVENQGAKPPPQLLKLGSKLPTEVSQLLCELRDSLRKEMKNTAALKKEKARLLAVLVKTAKAEEKTVQVTAAATAQYVPSAHFNRYDPSVVAMQRLAHTKEELASVHTVIDSQMKHMSRAFDTAAKKCELDKELMLLSLEVQKKKDTLQHLSEECQSIQRVWTRKKLSLARAPKPMDPMTVLQLDMQKEVAYDSLQKQESAAVAAKESIAYRANLLCQLERVLKVKAEAVEYILAQMEDPAAAAAIGVSSSSRGNSQSQERAESTTAGAGAAAASGGAASVRATTLTTIRNKIAALNKRDAALDEQLNAIDAQVSDSEYRAKVMVRSTESLEKERGRLLRQHDKQIAALHASAETQASMARALIDDERSRSVSQMA